MERFFLFFLGSLKLPAQFLGCACLEWQSTKTYKPHCLRQTNLTTVVIIAGVVICITFGLNHSLMCTGVKLPACLTLQPKLCFDGAQRLNQMLVFVSRLLCTEDECQSLPGGYTRLLTEAPLDVWQFGCMRGAAVIGLTLRLFSGNRSRNDAFVQDVPSFYNKEHGLEHWLLKCTLGDFTCQNSCWCAAGLK